MIESLVTAGITTVLLSVIFEKILKRAEDRHQSTARAMGAIEENYTRLEERFEAASHEAESAHAAPA
jgi:hypothetical protein